MRLIGILSIFFLSGFASLALAASTDQPPSPAQKTLTTNGEAVHDIGRVGLNVTNFGLIGSEPGTSQLFSDAPSLEDPLNGFDDDGDGKVDEDYAAIGQ